MSMVIVQLAGGDLLLLTLLRCYLRSKELGNPYLTPGASLMQCLRVLVLFKSRGLYKPLTLSSPGLHRLTRTRLLSGRR